MLAILPIILALTVHERRLAGRTLLRQARTDLLTGLPNRSAFESDMRRLLDDPAEPPLALAYLDLDNLKAGAWQAPAIMQAAQPLEGGEAPQFVATAGYFEGVDAVPTG